MNGWRVSPAEGLVSRSNQTLRLEPKVMEVLVYFASRAGEVITRDELERDVWHGALVGYDAVTATVIKLRRALGDDAKQPRFIATIPKKGYQLIAAITYPDDGNSLSANVFDNEQLSRLESDNPRRLLHKNISIGLLFALIAIGTILFWNSEKTGSTSNIKSSIVVLPFKNLSSDPEQEYLSQALTDDLITDLSKLQSLRVIARQSAYHYLQRKNYSLADVASELGVQYVVEGSVLKVQQHIRLNVQVTDVKKGESIWGERFDVPQQQIFTVQDDITQQVIKALYLQPTQKETLNIAGRGTKNFAAYEAFLQGQSNFKNRSKDGFDLAMQDYQRAIELDPGFARAYGAMAVALIRGNRGHWTRLSNEEAKSRALELARTAVSLNQTTPEVYWALGFVHLFRREYEEAEVAAKQTIILSPNYADGYGLLAFISNWRGKSQQAETEIRKAIDLNPYHTFDYPWNLGLSFYYQDRYKEAAEQLRAALQRNPTALYPRIFLAASYVRLGQLDDAEWEVEQLRSSRREATLSDLGSQMPLEHRQDLEKVLIDLRKAGLPE